MIGKETQVNKVLGTMMSGHLKISEQPVFRKYILCISPSAFPGPPKLQVDQANPVGPAILVSGHVTRQRFTIAMWSSWGLPWDFGG